MARVILPFEDWPESDRRAWAAAIETGDILDGQGPAAHWSVATRRTNIEHYGRWLGYLIGTDALARDLEPENRVTPEAVTGYLISLQAPIAPRTVTSALVGLKVMLKAMVPYQDWRWLADVCNRLNRTTQPSKDKRSRMRSTSEIVEAALSGLDKLHGTTLTRRLDRVAYRDHLMLAVMALRPLRLRNFAGLRIGQEFVMVAGRWVIDIPGPETKTGQPLLFDLPTVLQRYMETYLERVRPTFLTKAQNVTDFLWLGYEGQPLTAHSIYLRFIYLTERLFGQSINPHLLRDCAATTLSSLSVDDALAAAPLLGHRSFATTERYYIRANQLEASRNVAHALKLAQIPRRES